jgi:glutamate-1-semialdehyde 2,1-aminomutase
MPVLPSRIAQRPSHRPGHPLRDGVDAPPIQDQPHEDAMATEPAARPTPSLRRDKQAEMYRRALETLPGGTDSNFRAWGESTIYVDRGQGGMVWDIDGNEYVDLRMGYGPVILGHNDERVDDYVNERMRKGVSFSLTSEDEVRAMELVKELTGWVDKARMTVSGTEATMHAMRIARAYTGREKIVKFEGQYHGVHDYALISVGPDDMSELGDADAPVALAWGRGIPSAVADTIIPARYNHIERLRTLFEQRGEEIAAIIVEPVLGNAQGIMPQPGFHKEMRALTEEFGILLIFDEVKTGFRFAKGGAAEFFGITPDLGTFAKAMGNGYPAAAFGGREEVMAVLPDKVSHGGTYAGNRVAAAAAVKTLEIIRDTPVLETIHATGRRIQDGLREILNPTGIPYQFTGHPSMFGIMFTEHEASEYRDWANTDHELYDAIAIGMHARGAMPEPDSREPWFVCEAHAKGDIVDRVLTAFEDSMQAALDERAHGAGAVRSHGGMASPGDA